MSLRPLSAAQQRALLLCHGDGSIELTGMDKTPKVSSKTVYSLIELGYMERSVNNGFKNPLVTANNHKLTKMGIAWVHEHERFMIKIIHIQDAIKRGYEAAAACPDDGGSANLDHIVLTCFKGMREATLRSKGLRVDREKRGNFSFSMSFGGQGNKRYAGVQGMSKHLTAHGIDHYVNYIMD